MDSASSAVGPQPVQSYLARRSRPIAIDPREYMIEYEYTMPKRNAQTCPCGEVQPPHHNPQILSMRDENSCAHVSRNAQGQEEAAD